MKTTVAIVSRIALASALVSLSSCSLPPSAAWKIIRHDGLANYIAMETGKKPFPADLEVLRNRNRVHSSPTLTTGAMAANTSPYFDSNKQVPPAVAEPKSEAAPATASRLVFEVQPNGRGITPATAAPRAAAKTSEPKKAPVSTPPKPAVTKTTPKSESPVKSRTVENKAPDPAPKKSAPSVVSAPKKSADKTAEPSPAPAKKLTQATASTTPKVTQNDTAPAPTKTISELPYGSPVPGRAGLVHSPYAGKLQLVDVSGLAPGQEVKCPYSGKLFRVPSGDQAAAKKTESTPPAAKNEEEKKQ